MFRDLKEYQEIQKIYEDRVCISEEHQQFVNFVEQVGFTDEEIDYVIDNCDEFIDKVNEDNLTEAYLNEEELHEIKGLLKSSLKYLKNARLTKPVINQLSKIKNFKPVKGLIDKGKGIVNYYKGSFKDFGKRLKANPIKTLTPGKGVLIPGGAAIGAKAFMDVANKDKGKKDSITIDGGSGSSSTTDGSSTTDSKKDDTKTGDAGNKGAENIVKGDSKKDDTKTGDAGNKGAENIEKQLKDKVEKDAKKTKPMSKIEFQNRKRFGDEHVDHLKAKNVDFQAMKKGKMTKKEFIDKYPKSQTAKKYYNSDKAYRDYKKSLKKEGYSFAEAYQNIYEKSGMKLDSKKGKYGPKTKRPLPEPPIKTGPKTKRPLPEPPIKTGPKPKPQGGDKFRSGPRYHTGHPIKMIDGKPKKLMPENMPPSYYGGEDKKKEAVEAQRKKYGTGPKGSKKSVDEGVGNIIGKVLKAGSKVSKLGAQKAAVSAGGIGVGVGGGKLMHDSMKDGKKKPKMEEYDAYDLVLEYLASTEQVDSLEEANYIMMELDQQTIGEIVNEMVELKGLVKKIGKIGKKLKDSPSKPDMGDSPSKPDMGESEPDKPSARGGVPTKPKGMPKVNTRSTGFSPDAMRTLINRGKRLY